MSMPSTYTEFRAYIQNKRANDFPEFKTASEESKNLVISLLMQRKIYISKIEASATFDTNGIMPDFKGFYYCNICCNTHQGGYKFRVHLDTKKHKKAELINSINVKEQETLNCEKFGVVKSEKV